MGALLEILDPGQNMHFSDYFIDYPFSLGEVLFVCTGNNTKDVSTAVLDRLEIIEMPNYTDDEKIAIAKNYVLPKLIKTTGIMPNQLTIDDSLWPSMVRPLGYEPGVRSLERALQEIVRKVAYKVVSGQVQSVYINQNNINDYTPSMYVKT
jgi:ATP-dependent Lon protease